ncbi:MAG TPA: hypothetical protein VIV40_28610 [Kofleriaceae bacterium]
MMIGLPALAGTHAKKSLADCTSFTQTEKGDDAFVMSVHNSCKAQVDCSISWKVVCAPESQKRRAVHPSSSKFTLVEGTEQTAEASAAVCGDEAWTIESVTWGCEPSKD